MHERKLLPMVIWATLSLALPAAALGQAEVSKHDEKSCSTNTLPTELQKKLAEQFANWRIQELRDLSPAAKARWYAGYYTGCPGLAAGEFRENGRGSYALLLVPAEKPDSAYRLVMYTPAAAKSAEEFDVLDKQDAPGASNFFVTSEKTADLFDAAARRNSDITAKETMVAFEVGENQYQVNAYYWADGAYRAVPLDL